MNSPRQMSTILFCFCVLVFPLIFATVTIDERLIDCGPIISSKWGRLCGKWTRTLNGRQIENYFAIPYALPPIQNLRFKNPEPWNITWSGLLDSRFRNPTCLNIYSGIYSEDCLYLNVHVPEISRTKQERVLLPVLVLLHHNLYVEGRGNSTLYRPDYLLDKDMILVVVNYRMNIFGFFSTLNQASPGNYGLKDIVLALKWIQENIIDFNGDANSVTLMGNSFSSAMVHLLALSKKTEGLFHKYILISSSALSSWNMRGYDWKQYKKRGLNFAKFAGCLTETNPLHRVLQGFVNIQKENTNDIYNSYINSGLDQDLAPYYNVMMNCLRGLRSSHLVTSLRKFYSPLQRQEYFFGPTLEAESKDAILTMHPVKILKEGLFRDIPVIILDMKNEGLSLTREFVIEEKYFRNSKKTKLISEYKSNLRNYLDYYELITDTNKFAAAIEHFYFSGNIAANLMSNFTKVVGDGAIRWPMFKAIQHHSKFGNSHIYLFNFAYDGTFSFTVCCNYSDFDRTQYIEMEKIFGHGRYPWPIIYLDEKQSDHIIMNDMINMLENFLREGQPKADRLPSIMDYRSSSKFVKIGNDASTDITVETDFFTERMNFWDNLMPNVLNERNVDLYNMLISSQEK